MDISKTASNHLPASQKANVDLERAKEAGKQYEAFYMGFMLEQVFNNLPTDGFFGGGHAEKIYRSMLVQEYAKDITANTSLGLAEAVTKQLVETQAASNQGLQSIDTTTDLSALAIDKTALYNNSLPDTTSYSDLLPSDLDF